MKFPQNEIIALLDDKLKYNLGESTSKDLLLGELLDDILLNQIKSLKLEYGTTQGNADLRKLVGKKLGVSSNSILITNGAVAGIFLSILCLCEQIDEVITVQPNFPPTIDVIEGLGFKRKIINLKFEEKYKIDENKLIELVTDKTRLIILASPLNPSGTTITKKKVTSILNKINKIAPKCYLLIDETFREAIYGNNIIEKSFANISGKILTTGSLSKCHGTPGLRIGWLSCMNDDLLLQLKTTKLNTSLSNSLLDELVAIKVLQMEKQIIGKSRKHLQKGFKITKEWISKNTELIDWVEPDSGALCCVRLNTNKFSEFQIDNFYKKAKVAQIQLASGEWFGETKRIFRVGFGYMEIKNLKFALKKLTGILQELANK